MLSYYIDILSFSADKHVPSDFLAVAGVDLPVAMWQ